MLSVFAMQDATNALKAALRVVTAITDRRQPDPADVQASAYAPQFRDMPLNKLAGAVIRDATDALKAERGKAASA